MIVLWWFAYSALTSLFDEGNKRHSRIISAVFLATGLCSLGSVELSMFSLLNTVDKYNKLLNINLYFVFGWRTITTFLGIIVGGMIYTIVLHIKQIIWLSDSRIRERAYYIWLESGQPSGMSEEHWNRARQECEREFGRK